MGGRWFKLKGSPKAGSMAVYISSTTNPSCVVIFVMAFGMALAHFRGTGFISVVQHCVHGEDGAMADVSGPADTRPRVLLSEAALYVGLQENIAAFDVELPEQAYKDIDLTHKRYRDPSFRE